MATISKPELESAFARLGQLAAADGEHLDFLLLGGGVMVLALNARESTRDVDVVILAPANRSVVREYVEVVARERGWPIDWLNEGAKGFVVNPTIGATLISIVGLTVRMPIIEQLLAMKLCAWRDDVDIADATCLLKELAANREGVWSRISAYLQPGRELKARYAFDDLWESLHGKN